MKITALRSKAQLQHDFFENFKTKFKVKHLMSTDVMTLPLNANLNLIDSSLDWRKYRHLPIIDSQRHVKGMISHRDLMNDFASSFADPERNKKYSSLEQVSVKEVMVSNLTTIDANTSLREAAKCMYDNQWGCLPVVDSDKKLVGILTEADFVRLIYLGEDSLSS